MTEPILAGDGVYLLHIRDACRRILDFCSTDEAGFRSDLMRQDAVLRNFQVIGEAAKKVSSETRERSPGIPWRQITGMRDNLVHGYFDVDLTVVWEAARRDVPLLGVAVETLLRDLRIEPDSER